MTCTRPSSIATSSASMRRPITPLSSSTPYTSALYHDPLSEPWIPCQLAVTAHSTPQVGERVLHLRSSSRSVIHPFSSLSKQSHQPVTFTFPSLRRARV